eukprot:jgi/Chlat1/8622/Chrsp86S08025
MRAAVWCSWVLGLIVLVSVVSSQSVTNEPCLPQCVIQPPVDATAGLGFSFFNTSLCNFPSESAAHCFDRIGGCSLCNTAVTSDSASGSCPPCICLSYYPHAAGCASSASSPPSRAPSPSPAAGPAVPPTKAPPPRLAPRPPPSRARAPVMAPTSTGVTIDLRGEVVPFSTRRRRQFERALVEFLSIPGSSVPAISVVSAVALNDNSTVRVTYMLTTNPLLQETQQTILLNATAAACNNTNTIEPDPLLVRFQIAGLNVTSACPVVDLFAPAPSPSNNTAINNTSPAPSSNSGTLPPPPDNGKLADGWIVLIALLSLLVVVLLLLALGLFARHRRRQYYLSKRARETTKAPVAAEAETLPTSTSTTDAVAPQESLSNSGAAPDPRLKDASYMPPIHESSEIVRGVTTPRL